jgi:hypothetical protein
LNSYIDDLKDKELAKASPEELRGIIEHHLVMMKLAIESEGIGAKAYIEAYDVEKSLMLLGLRDELPSVRKGKIYEAFLLMQKVFRVELTYPEDFDEEVRKLCS